LLLFYIIFRGSNGEKAIRKEVKKGKGERTRDEGRWKTDDG
jgi:hypothetical protein